jgi:hypothetical protein
MKPTLPPPLHKGKPTLRRIQRVCMKCGGEEFLPAHRCAWCDSMALRNPLPDEQVIATRKILCINTKGNWGIGINAEQAMMSIVKKWWRGLPMKGAKVNVWDCPRSAYVDIKGKIIVKAGDPQPVLVRTETMP